MLLPAACAELIKVALNPDSAQNPMHQMALQLMSQNVPSTLSPNSSRRTKLHVALDPDTQKRFDAYQKQTGETNMSRLMSQLILVGINSKPQTMALQKKLLDEHKPT